MSGFSSYIPYLRNLEERYAQLYDEVDELAEEYELGTVYQRDAFRHAYASAVMTVERGDYFTHLLGIAHELDVRNSHNEAHQDLWNNLKGREFAREVGLDKSKLAERVLRGLRHGELIVDRHGDKRRVEAGFWTDPLSWLVIQRSTPDEK